MFMGIVLERVCLFYRFQQPSSYQISGKVFISNSQRFVKREVIFFAFYCTSILVSHKSESAVPFELAILKAAEK